RAMPARIDVKVVCASRPTEVTMPTSLTTIAAAPRRSKRLVADDAFRLDGARDRDDRRLQHGERRRVLVVVQHDVERAAGVLALELHVEREQHDFRLALDLARHVAAAGAAGLVARAHLEVRVLYAGRLAVALDLLRALRRVARHRDVRIR